ncbi:GtrA family protein [Adlercreutzia sp. ZJ304]|uniref:GtrA family protein n=1 Tax=Adlercreutzia sp. ZJ304 TaxID=2709791 RepID=UPI0013EB2F5D|nr:GtrA family protein [Adlercreutzia sp. ZJ304]
MAGNTKIETSDDSKNASTGNAHAKTSILRQGALYIFVGVSSALIELILFQLLYHFEILNVELSNIVAVVIATIYNFLLNGTVTFKGTKNPLLSLVKYLLLFAFNLAFTTITISFLVSIGWDSLIAKLITMACVVLWNFVLYRKVVFV